MTPPPFVRTIAVQTAFPRAKTTKKKKSLPNTQENLTTTLQIRLTPPQQAQLRTAARQIGLSTSAWARLRLLECAKEELSAK